MLMNHAFIAGTSDTMESYNDSQRTYANTTLRVIVMPRTERKDDNRFQNGRPWATMQSGLIKAR